MSGKIKTKVVISPEQLSDSNRVTPLKLYKYVWGLCAILGLFLISFGTAYVRVAQSEKFDRQPFKSITHSENQKDNLTYPEKK